MMKASLGDDVFNEDDSVKKLEQYVATLCGHEAALFCASGTMSNQLAHRVHLCNPPQSALVDIRSHVFNYEAGGISFHSQAAVCPVMPANGKYLTVEDIASRLVFDVDVHYAPTRVISLENTLNGTLMPLEEIVRIRQLTQEHGIKLHLDGARLWHASVATGISMSEYCRHFDTVSLCLSKGIGAPIGSILVGSEAAIKKARHFRLLFGGGWRQAGLLAEAALWGIKTNWPTMDDTHRRAKWLERAFLQVGCQITNPVDTNMVWVDTSLAGFTVDELMTVLAKDNIKISGSGCATRIVLHYQITDDAVARFIDVLRQLASTPRMKVNVDLVKTSMIEEPESIMAEKNKDKVEMEDVQEATLDTTTPNTPISPLSSDYPTIDGQVPVSRQPTVTARAPVYNDEEDEEEDDELSGEIMQRHTYYDGSDMAQYQQCQCLFQEGQATPSSFPRKLRRAMTTGAPRQGQSIVECEYYSRYDGGTIDSKTRSEGGREYEHEREHEGEQQPLVVKRRSNWLNRVANEHENEHGRKQRQQHQQNELRRGHEWTQPREPQPHHHDYSDENENQDEDQDVTMIPRIPRSRSLDLSGQHRKIHSIAVSGYERSPIVGKRKNTIGYRISHNPASKALKRASSRIARWSGSLLTKET